MELLKDSRHRAFVNGFVDGLTAYTNIFVPQKIEASRYFVSDDYAWARVGEAMRKSINIELERMSERQR